MAVLKNDDVNTPQKTALTLIALIILNLFVYFLLNALETEEVLYEDMIKKLDHETAIEQIKNFQRTGFILTQYFFYSLWLLFKLAGITAIVILGLYAYNIKVTFAEAFKVLLLPAFIFLIPDVLQIAWFNMVQTNYQMSDLKNFPRFSLFELLMVLHVILPEDFLSLVKELLRPFTIFNLLFCWFVARRLADIKPDDTSVFRAVFISYFTGLTILNLVLYGIVTFATSFVP
jgi:hypothetical protein